MISIIGVDYAEYTREGIVSLAGLSTDPKPIREFDNYTLSNGSTFLEMDTSNMFMYDEANHIWRKL